jgi:hypothetical protein
MNTLKRTALVCGLLSAAGCAHPPDGGESPPAPLVEGSSGIATIDLPGSGPTEVEYFVQNGQAVYYGDIVLSDAQLNGSGSVPVAAEVPSQQTDSVGRLLQTYRWPGGVIPYNIDTTQFPVGSAEYQKIQTALSMWAYPNTPLTFSQCSASSPWQPNCPGRADWVVITINHNKDGSVDTGDDGTSSSIGRQANTGAHTIKIGGTSTAGTIAHELGHMIGLYHEQQRADRDQYLIVYDGKSPIGCSGSSCYPDHFSSCGDNAGGYLRYADTSPPGNDGVDLQPFDFASVMLYGASLTDCCNGTPCMTDRNGKGFTSAKVLSSSDLAAVTRMYSGAPLQDWIGRSNIILL